MQVPSPIKKYFSDVQNFCWKFSWKNGYIGSLARIGLCRETFYEKEGWMRTEKPQQDDSIYLVLDISKWRRIRSDISAGSKNLTSVLSSGQPSDDLEMMTWSALTSSHFRQQRRTMKKLAVRVSSFLVSVLSGCCDLRRLMYQPICMGRADHCGEHV